MMAKLTDEQFRVAHRMMLDEGYAVSEMLMAKLAAYLQLPWDEPTDEEALLAENYLRSHGGGWSSAKVVLMEFVCRRNASLLPKPVDPRLEVVESIIARGRMHLSKDQRTLAAEILAALAEVK
jgi:hypothetical protein